MRASEPPGSLSTSYTRACKLGKATTLSLAEQQEQFVLNDLKTSAIGLRRGWSVSRAPSWTVCFADKTRAHGNLRQVWLIEGCACAGSAVNAANPSSTRVNASSAGCNCLDPAPVHKSPADSTQPHSGCSNARGGRQKESQTIALVDVKPCALLNTVNAPRRMLGRGGDRPGEAVRGKHSKYMPGAGRDGGNIRYPGTGPPAEPADALAPASRGSRGHLSHTPRSLTRMRSASSRGRLYGHRVALASRCVGVLM